MDMNMAVTRSLLSSLKLPVVGLQSQHATYRLFALSTLEVCVDFFLLFCILSFLTPSYHFIAFLSLPDLALPLLTLPFVI